MYEFDEAKLQARHEVDGPVPPTRQYIMSLGEFRALSPDEQNALTSRLKKQSQSKSEARVKARHP